ncbi:Ku protein [Streptomyces sp. NPDC047974]|uniref:Ku protein n=1 Tax=Streptomyces sp. NPDC047974 TaxID=3154343 RepID=UPI0033D90A82
MPLPLRFRKICDLGSRKLREDETGRAYEVSRDHLVPVTDAHLKQMPPSTARGVEFVAFVPAGTITPQPYGAGDSYLRAEGDIGFKPHLRAQKAATRQPRSA